MSAAKEPYFIKDRNFYAMLFHLMIVVTLQNFVNYSVNMADNLMLGRYGQVEMSAAAVVSQIFFVITGLVGNFGSSFSVLAAQYWGKKRTDRINMLAATLLRVNVTIGVIFFAASAIMPYKLVGIFTSDEQIIEQAVIYLRILKYTFIPYGISYMIMDMLRNVETVGISFGMSVASLVINVSFNYMLIFGKAGFPELGIAGAAVSTLIARLTEVVVLVGYALFVDKKLRFFKSKFWKVDRQIEKDFAKVALQVVPAGIGWNIATPVQTALIGRISSEAIAANSVANTFYQLLKVVAQALSAAAAVVIGKLVGEREIQKVRSGARTIELLGLGIGLIMGGLLFLARNLILSLYVLTPATEALTAQMLIVMSVVMVGMDYEVPVLFGVVRAGGDAKFPSIVNMVAMWAIVMPVAFMAVFWWGLDAIWVVVIIQSEQLIKCLPAALRIRQYGKWIHDVTRV